MQVTTEKRSPLQRGLPWPSGLKKSSYCSWLVTLCFIALSISCTSLTTIWNYCTCFLVGFMRTQILSVAFTALSRCLCQAWHILDAEACRRKYWNLYKMQSAINMSKILFISCGSSRSGRIPHSEASSGPRTRCDQLLLKAATIWLWLM